MAAAECSVARRAPAQLASGLRARTMRACAGAFMLDVACCIVALWHVAGCDRSRAQSQQVCARLPIAHPRRDSARIRAGTQRLRWALLLLREHAAAACSRAAAVNTPRAAAACRPPRDLPAGSNSGGVLCCFGCVCLPRWAGWRAGGSKPCLAGWCWCVTGGSDAAPCSLVCLFVCLFVCSLGRHAALASTSCSSTSTAPTSTLCALTLSPPGGISGAAVPFCLFVLRTGRLWPRALWPLRCRAPGRLHCSTRSSTKHSHSGALRRPVPRRPPSRSSCVHACPLRRDGHACRRATAGRAARPRLSAWLAG